ncbi:hypothetical protein PLICRDRAFT_39402 [Plicaturopsis crispa FD-325 SS-3]|nr:hypothetical protein PLICRDRAFT_39402 [Plicaturopsis crispa FD-325 SS-3]
MPESQRAVRWYPPSYDIRVETVPVPKIEQPDDAIVKIRLAGLCGSDLHIYRGHEGITEPLICGHEFIGEVVALGSSFHQGVLDRPQLYSTLRVGDRVVSPFTVSCGECHFCRVGFTCRCVVSTLFGIPKLPGGQAQYVRVPKAGGTLFSLSSPELWPGSVPKTALEGIADSSLLLLADILPTGAFAALQAIQHPKVLPMITGRPYPATFLGRDESERLEAMDTKLTLAVIGLGPVGVCACVSLLDMLAARDVNFQIVAVDPNVSRREKMEAVYSAIDASGRGKGQFTVASIEESQGLVSNSCNAVLEIVGNNSALTLAYDLVRPFGAIVSVGVHQSPPVPFAGVQLYDKNVSFDFGRCPVRAMFPIAFDILVKRQDVFGGVGEYASLVEKIVGFEGAADVYEAFDKGKCGKMLFDPWM